MSLGWLSIGANGEIALTDLNVDKGTLKVKVDTERNIRRVGINVGIEPVLQPGEQPVEQIKSITQIGTTEFKTDNLTNLSSVALSVFNDLASIPSAGGIQDLSANVIVSSTAVEGLNKGGSIGIGGVFKESETVSVQTMFTRISGLRTNAQEERGGDFSVETLAPAGSGTADSRLFERFRILSNGNVGIGVSNPKYKTTIAGGLHVGLDEEDFYEGEGLVNRGFQINVPDKIVPPSNSNMIDHRIKSQTASTIIAPTPGTRGFTVRYDSDGYKEVIHSMVTVAGTPSRIYAAGEFKGDVPVVYSDDGQAFPSVTVPTSNVPFRDGRLNLSAGFVSATDATNGTLENFMFMECIPSGSDAPGDVVLTSITVSSGISPQVVFVTGFIEGKVNGSNILRIYNRGTTINPVRDITLGVMNGRRVGFVMTVNEVLTFQTIAFQYGSTAGTLTNSTLQFSVTPVSCKFYQQTFNSTTNNYLLVSGMFSTFSTDPGLRIDNINYTSGTGTNNPGSPITFARGTNGQSDIYLIRYKLISASSLQPDRLNAAGGSTAAAEVMEYGSTTMDVDPVTKDIYLCANAKVQTLLTFVGTSSTTHPMTTHTNFGRIDGAGSAASTGVLWKFKSQLESMPILWITKVQPSDTTSVIKIRSLAVTLENVPVPGSSEPVQMGFVYFIGTNTGTQTRFYNGATVSPFVPATTTCAMITPSDTSNGGFVVIAKYRDDGVYQWSTICKTNSKKVEGAFIKIDSSNTIYTGFEYVDPAQIESKENVVVDVFQRSGRSPITATSFTPSISNHIIRGQLSFIGIVAFNPDGKVLFTSKIDGGGGERITALDVFDIDGRYDIVVGMTSSGEQFNCFDMSGISFRFVSGLTKDLSDSRPSAFIVGLPTFHFYLIDPAPSGAVHKVINVSQQRGFVIPYYEKENVEQTFTNGIFSVPERSAVELTFIKGGSGDNEGTWFAAKDPDAGLIVIDKVNGGVGIGTTDPLELLHVEGSAFLKGDLRVAGRIINPLINFGLDGEIGIGVTGDPKGYLHINKDTGTGVNFRPSILLQSPGNGEFSGSLDFRDNIDAGFRFQHRTGGNLTVDLLRSGASVASPPMLTFTHGVGAGQSITDNNARIGIGTDEPEAKLHVQGSMVVKGSATISGNTTFDSSVVIDDSVKNSTATPLRVVGINNNFAWFDWYTLSVSPYPAVNRWRKVIWISELNLFFAVGLDRRIGISNDGVFWSIGDQFGATTEWYGAAWSSPLQRIVLIGGGGTSRLAYSSSTNFQFTFKTPTESTDLKSNNYRAITWANTTGSPASGRGFVGVSREVNSGSTWYSVRSFDGISWATWTSPAGPWYGITFRPSAGGYYLACGSGKVMKSVTGSSWTNYNISSSFDFRDVIWVDELGLFVAVGVNIAAWSLNGESTWTGISTSGVVSAPLGSFIWHSVAWSPEREVLVAVSTEGRTIVSKDGKTWSSVSTPSPSSGQSQLSITWSPEKEIFVSVGSMIGNSLRGVSLISRLTYKTAAEINGDLRIGTAIMSRPIGNAPLYSVRAWLNFNGKNMQVRNSGNIRSVLRVDNGVYDINFIRPMPVEYFAVFVGSSANNSGLRDPDYSTASPTGLEPTTSKIRIITTAPDSTSFRNWANVSVIVVC